MKRIILVLIACQNVFALQSPTITGLVALSDTTVRLTWQSNDSATLGFYILRVDPSMSVGKVIDTLPAADTEYVDTVLPGETYVFGIVAFSADEVSNPPSDSSIKMPGERRIFLAPGLSGRWDTVTASVQLRIIDKATAEIGYKVLRAENFGAFSERTVFLSTNPALKDTLSFSDNTVKMGAWYTYRVIVYNSTRTDSSETSVFAYLKGSMRPVQMLVPGPKISSFPIRYGSWALKQGDTICVQQDSIPFDSCTLIDVGDRANPVFAGRIKNTVPLRLEEPQSHACLGSSLLYRNRAEMVHYRFFNGTVDSVCSVPLYYQNITPMSPSLGEVVGMCNNNTVVTRYYEFKGIHYDLWFFSQEKLVPLGAFQGAPLNRCIEARFLFFRAGRAWDCWINGTGKGDSCDMSNPVQKVYLSYDFSFDPLTPVENGGENVPDTVLREYSGYLTSDELITRSKAVFIDSAKSLLYLLSGTELSVYGFSLKTQSLQQPQNPSFTENRISVRYRSAGRRLCIDYGGIPGNARMRIILFSLDGTLLFAQETVPGKNVSVPHGISGMVLVRVVAPHKRVEGKIIIAP